MSSARSADETAHVLGLAFIDSLPNHERFGPLERDHDDPDLLWKEIKPVSVRINGVDLRRNKAALDAFFDGDRDALARVDVLEWRQKLERVSRSFFANIECQRAWRASQAALRGDAAATR